MFDAEVYWALFQTLFDFVAVVVLFLKAGKVFSGHLA